MENPSTRWVFRVHTERSAIAACPRRRSWNSIPTASCCAWGGPADPDKCKAAEGCVWPATEHGIFVDHNGFVYLGGNNPNGNPNGSAWASTNGADGMILKFTKDGKFVMMIGGPGGRGPDSNNKDGGRNGTPLFYLP